MIYYLVLYTDKKNPTVRGFITEDDYDNLISGKYIVQDRYTIVSFKTFQYTNPDDTVTKFLVCMGKKNF